MFKFLRKTSPQKFCQEGRSFTIESAGPAGMLPITREVPCPWGSHSALSRKRSHRTLKLGGARMARNRLQFDLTDEALKEVDELRQETGLSTRAELIRNALRFLQWALEQIRDHKANLLIEKDGKIREVVFPFWNSTERAKAESQISMSRS